MATEPYTLTKMDVAALKQADYLYVQCLADKTDVRVTKRVEKTEKNPFAQDIDYHLTAPVRLAYSYRHETNNAQCRALVYLYQSQKTPATSIINTLRAGDSIRFEFYADYHSTQATREKTGFHGDALLLFVYDAKGRKVAEWELAQSFCEDNSARMCRGVYEKRVDAPEYSLA